MKKIKKINELFLDSELSQNESSKTTGGYESRKIVMCGCCGCSYQDGGPGFNIGMRLTKTPGHDCTWYSIRMMGDTSPILT